MKQWQSMVVIGILVTVLLQCTVGFAASIDEHHRTASSPEIDLPEAREIDRSGTQALLENMMLDWFKTIETRKHELDWLSTQPAFRQSLSAMTRKLLQSKRFLTELTRAVQFEYPELIVVMGLMAAVRHAVIYPMLAVTGNAHWFVFFTVSPDQELTVSLIVAYKKWRKSQRLRREFGLGLRELRQGANEIFGAQSLEEMRLHVLQSGTETIFLPIRKRGLFQFKKAMDDAHILQPGELDAILANADFSRAARDVATNPYMLEEILLHQIIADPQAHARLLERIGLFVRATGPSSAASALANIRQTQAVIRAEIDRSGRLTHFIPNLFSQETRERRKAALATQKQLYAINRQLENLEFATVAAWIKTRTFAAESFEAEWQRLHVSTLGLIGRLDEWLQDAKNRSASPIQRCEFLFGRT